MYEFVLAADILDQPCEFHRRHTCINWDSSVTSFPGTSASVRAWVECRPPETQGSLYSFLFIKSKHAAAAAKSLQSCPTLCDPRDSSPPGSTVPGILQARTLEWVAISFSNAWKWKVKVKSLSHVWLFETPWTAAYQAPPSMGFSRMCSEVQISSQCSKCKDKPFFYIALVKESLKNVILKSEFSLCQLRNEDQRKFEAFSFFELS